MSIVVRKPSVDDATRMIAYMKELLSEPNIALPLTADEFTTTVAEEEVIIEKALANPNELFLLATDGDLVVGMLNNNPNQRSANIHDTSFGITVARPYRGRGVGRMLLETFLEWASSHPMLKSVSLTVWKSNKRAVGLYKSLGFRTCGLRRYSVFRYGRFQPVLSMEKLLKKTASAFESRVR